MINMNLKAVIAAAIAAQAIGGAAFAQDTTLRLGHLANEQNIWHKAAQKFAEEVETLSEGRVAVEIYPNDTLGSEVDLINGMQLGTADMTITGETLQNWAPLAALLALPYAYSSLEQMDEVASGPIGDEIEQQIIDEAGVRPLAYFARGPRQLSANRAITTPAELDGLKLRVPNVPLFLDVWQELGAQPTPMAFSEVFTSLQNGTIQAQENPLSLVQSANFNEVQSTINMTNHVRSWIYLAISELTWEGLSEEDQQAVAEAAKRAQEYERSLFLENEQAIRADLEEKGVNFVEVDEAAFAEQAREAVIAGVSDEIRPTVEQIFDMQK